MGAAVLSKRSTILIGMTGGALWAFFVVAVPILFVRPALFPANLALFYASFMPGLVLMAMIGRLAMRRFFEDIAIDGGEFPPGSPGDVDQRVLQNTVEQCLLAAMIWPLAAFTLGTGPVLWMAAGFIIARLAFWIGYHKAALLRAFGFAATFYPTVLAGLWTLWRLVT